MSKGEIKKRVDRLWKEVDSETKNLYREKASQLGHGPGSPGRNQGLPPSHSMVPNSNPNIMSSLESMVFPSNIPNTNIPPPPLPEDETPVDLAENDDKGPKLVTLQCPIKNDPSLQSNDGEPAPKLQSI